MPSKHFAGTVFTGNSMLFYDIPKVTGSKGLRFWRGAIHCRNGSETDGDASMRFDRSDHRCDVSHCVQHHFRGWTSGKTVPIWSKIQCTLPPCSFKDLCISMVNMVHVCPCCYIRFLCNIKCNIKCITWLESNPGPFGRQLRRYTDFSSSEYDFARAPPEVSTDVTDVTTTTMKCHFSTRPKTKDSQRTKQKKTKNVCLRIWIFDWKKHLAGWMDISKRNGLQRWMHLICSRVRGWRPRETLHRIERENMVSDLVFVRKLLQESSESSVLCLFFC